MTYKQVLKNSEEERIYIVLSLGDRPTEMAYNTLERAHDVFKGII